MNLALVFGGQIVPIGGCHIEGLYHRAVLEVPRTERPNHSTYSKNSSPDPIHLELVEPNRRSEAITSTNSTHSATSTK